MLYFDLDHFKDVNDTLGHAIGDALLRQVAMRVVTSVRGNDFVARFGGDEFAILQGDVDELDAASTLAAKIGNVVADPYFIEGNEVHVSASIGTVSYTHLDVYKRQDRDDRSAHDRRTADAALMRRQPSPAAASGSANLRAGCESFYPAWRLSIKKRRSRQRGLKHRKRYSCRHRRI